MKNAGKTAAVVAKHGSQIAAARALGIGRSTVQHRLKSEARAAAPRSGNGVGFTRQDFRAKYDKSFIVPQRIREALKKLGANHYMPEGDFIKLAGISNTDMGAYRSQFEEEFVVVVERTKRIWCGSAAFARELRGES